jgi:cytochrome c biogenesis protein CcdA
VKQFFKNLLIMAGIYTGVCVVCFGAVGLLGAIYYALQWLPPVISGMLLIAGFLVVPAIGITVDEWQ